MQNTMRVPGLGGRGRAFTMIEVLVCVAVIGVLLGIVLPALSRAREAGRNVVCLSRLRELSLSTVVYAHAYHIVPVWDTVGRVEPIEMPPLAWWCPSDRLRPAYEMDSSYAYMGLLYMGDNANIAEPLTLNPAHAMRLYEDNPYLPLFRDLDARHPHRNVAFWDGVARKWWDN